MIINNKRLIIMLSSVLLLLIVPLVAMQITNEVNWNITDFIVASVLLFGTVAGIELIIRIIKRPQLRLSLIVLSLVFLFVTWIELAVGIF